MIREYSAATMMLPASVATSMSTISISLRSWCVRPYLTRTALKSVGSAGLEVARERVAVDNKADSVLVRTGRLF